MSAATPTEVDVLAQVSYDEARTTQEIADLVAPRRGWEQRGNVRNRLYSLEERGLVICDEDRPMRWIRPEGRREVRDGGPDA